MAPPPVLLPGKSHGRRSLVGCSPWGRKELDTTECLHFHFSLSCIGEGNGNPLQCSCLENPRDGAAWWAAVYGVAQSWTRLRRLSSSDDQITTVSYIFTHLQAQNFPHFSQWGAPSSCLHIFFTCPHYFLRLFKISGTAKCCRLSCYFPDVDLGICHFSDETWLLSIEKWNLETKIWTLAVLMATWMSVTVESQGAEFISVSPILIQ